jgi:hypothetical protein
VCGKSASQRIRETESAPPVVSDGAGPELNQGSAFGPGLAFVSFRVHAPEGRGFVKPRDSDEPSLKLGGVGGRGEGTLGVFHPRAYTPACCTGPSTTETRMKSKEVAIDLYWRAVPVQFQYNKMT